MATRKKKITFGFAILIIFFLTGYFLVKKIDSGGFEKELVPDYSQSGSDWKGLSGPLLESKWRQDTVFASFSPNHELLGCWSIAFAQVLAYHKLQPEGRVSYTTSSGVSIDEELIPVNLDKVVSVIDSTIPIESFMETAKYCYMVALVLQKDFGIGDYMDISVIPAEVSDHFKCTVVRQDTSFTGTIQSEIANGRPVIAYFNDILAIKITTNGHAVVFDGIAAVNNENFIHVNFGWGGQSDGWYNLRSLSSERKLKYIFTLSKK